MRITLLFALVVYFTTYFWYAWLYHDVPKVPSQDRSILRDYIELDFNHLEPSHPADWNRPESTSSRQDHELMENSSRELLSTSDPVGRLRLLCLSRGASSIMGLGRVFRRMDEQGTKHLNKEEFFQCIKQTGVNLSPDHEDELFDTFDTEKSGTIRIEDFLNHIRPPMSDSRRMSVENAFRKLDKDFVGSISLKHLRRIYDVTSHPRYMSGEDSAELILDKFIGSFGEQGSSDGRVTMDEFMDYYSGLSVAIDTDCYFDLMLRQAYKL